MNQLDTTANKDYAVERNAAANHKEKKTFVVDDSVVQRFGKKMPDISSHFDHTTGRHMMGQQVLMLGLSCEDGFVPLDNEIFTSKSKFNP